MDLVNFPIIFINLDNHLPREGNHKQHMGLVLLEAMMKYGPWDWDDLRCFSEREQERCGVDPSFQLSHGKKEGQTHVSEKGLPRSSCPHQLAPPGWLSNGQIYFPFAASRVVHTRHDVPLLPLVLLLPVLCLGVSSLVDGPFRFSTAPITQSFRYAHVSVLSSAETPTPPNN